MMKVMMMRTKKMKRMKTKEVTRMKTKRTKMKKMKRSIHHSRMHPTDRTTTWIKLSMNKRKGLQLSR